MGKKEIAILGLQQNTILPHSKTFQIPRVCEECGKNFMAKTSVTRFCSTKCYQRQYYNRHLKNKSPCLKAPIKAAESKVEPESDFLTIKQFCKKLSVCKQTVYNMAALGDVRIIRLNVRRVYIRWSEFLATLNTRSLHDKPSIIKRSTGPSLVTKNSLPVASLPTDKKALHSEIWIDRKTACQRYGLIPASFDNFVSKAKIPRILLYLC